MDSGYEILNQLNEFQTNEVRFKQMQIYGFWNSYGQISEWLLVKSRLHPELAQKSPRCKPQPSRISTSFAWFRLITFQNLHTNSFPGS
jgi:hypothetical protein